MIDLPVSNRRVDGEEPFPAAAFTWRLTWGRADETGRELPPHVYDAHLKTPFGIRSRRIQLRPASESGD